MKALEALQFLIQTLNQAQFNSTLPQAIERTNMINEAARVINEALQPKELKAVKDDKKKTG